MLKTILQASENFCIHQIRLPYKVSKSLTKKRTLIAYIDIDTNDNKKYRVYIASEYGFIQKVAKLFLEEDECDEESLIDMLLETTNLIVGSAKVISAEESESSYTIGTPHFEKIDVFKFTYDDAKTINVEGDKMIIAIKELNV
ncbi:MAG: chemotaxis protein CheX [Campylobacterales bacterium]|nr:chemotaxis protein CheX [Campylobacterales bacterium]